MSHKPPKRKINTWLDENRDRYHGFDSTLSFVEQLWGMPYLERCIVLGIVMGESNSEILHTLNSQMSKDDLDYLLMEKGLQTWHFARALLEN